MNKIACQYAIIRFSPFIETGEFANVGIVMIASKYDTFFDFRLASKRYSRITQFFNKIDNTIYKKTIKNIENEMERVSKILQQNSNDPSLQLNIFNEITRPRETIIYFSHVRTVLTDDPKKQLDNLFSYYVEHSFVTKKYQESLLEEKVHNLLCTANIRKNFTKKDIGNSRYHVTFPFVNKGRNLNRIIKPLHLNYNNTTQIYNHGGAWIFKINTLKDKHHLNAKNVLFALSEPEEKEGNQWDAYQEMKNSLFDTGVQISNINQNSDDIVAFALGKNRQNV